MQKTNCHTTRLIDVNAPWGQEMQI
uniref:Uncharacterized protein n=1 Tax=Anguilla anguilla TaxID=7936 RepID=A0A0E9QJJ8_ANGAN